MIEEALTSSVHENVVIMHDGTALVSKLGKKHNPNHDPCGTNI